MNKSHVNRQVIKSLIGAMTEALNCPSEQGYLMNRKGEPYGRVVAIDMGQSMAFCVTDRSQTNIKPLLCEYVSQNMADNEAVKKIINKLV